MLKSYCRNIKTENKKLWLLGQNVGPVNKSSENTWSRGRREEKRREESYQIMRMSTLLHHHRHLKTGRAALQKPLSKHKKHAHHFTKFTYSLLEKVINAYGCIQKSANIYNVCMYTHTVHEHMLFHMLFLVDACAKEKHLTKSWSLTHKHPHLPPPPPLAAAAAATLKKRVMWKAQHQVLWMWLCYPGMEN